MNHTSVAVGVGVLSDPAEIVADIQQLYIYNRLSSIPMSAPEPDIGTYARESGTITEVS